MRDRFKWKYIISTWSVLGTVTLLSLMIFAFWGFVYFHLLFDRNSIHTFSNQGQEPPVQAAEYIAAIALSDVDQGGGMDAAQIADFLSRKAEEQASRNRSAWIYYKKINEKNMIIKIEVRQLPHGTVHRYSIIEDEYIELFPDTVAIVLILFLCLFVISYFYGQITGDMLYRDVHNLRDYTKSIIDGKHPPHLQIMSDDLQFYHLTQDLNILNDTLYKRADMRQKTLQYISHEMKTPIMVIESYTSAALDEIYPKGTLSASLETVLLQNERLKQRVNDLLNIVRTDTMPTASEENPVAVLPCIREVCRLFSCELEQKKLCLGVPKEAVILGDKLKLNILLENLISNQIKYCRHFISISAQERDGELILYFYNDGNPIPAEMRESVFQPFVKGSGQGSGLGLSICKTVAAQLGGKIMLGETRKGTLFVLRLPCRPS